jgi:hypothetical protein
VLANQNRALRDTNDLLSKQAHELRKQIPGTPEAKQEAEKKKARA